jgi:cell division transport system permease protein
MTSTLAYFRIMADKAEDIGKKGLRTSYISTVIGISLVLFMIGLVLGGVFGLQSVQRQAKESLQGDVFFKSTLNDADIKQVELQLKSWNEFSEVYFVSPERAIKEFGGENYNERDMLAIFSGENPLPPTICFHPKEQFANRKGMELINKKLMSRFTDEIDEVNYDKATVENVNLGFKQFVLLFLSVALLLIIIAVAMINNTIRLALYSKRFTIKTMQLVGATGGYIRKPFLWQAILQGIVSAIIGLALLLTVFYAWNNVLISFEINYTIQTFLLLVGSLIIIGVFITLISTWFALNKYLRMKLDDLY